MANNTRNLPTHPYSLHQFCQKALELRETDDAEFVKFVLSGRYNDRQAVIDPIVDNIEGHRRYKVLRDYDSLLGITPDVMVHGSIVLYPLARRDDTLSSNIHMSYHFRSSSGEWDKPVHTVPNLCLGKWGTHNMLRVFLPDLYTEGCSPFPSQDSQRIFYEDGLLPAINSLTGSPATEWPATYDDGMFQARLSTGRLLFQTKILSAHYVSDLAFHIRNELTTRGHTMGIGLVILHQIRGVKEANRHSFSEEAAKKALIVFLNNNLLLGEGDEISDLLDIPESMWCIDTAVEITMGDKTCAQWRTDGHCDMVAKVCRIPVETAARITRPGSSHYSRDIASHLPVISGCRITPKKTARGPLNIWYLQMYTTEKSIIYNPEKGHFGKFVTCTQILSGSGSQFADKLYQLYRNAIPKNYSLARIEVRVPLQHATKALLNLDYETISSSIISFHPNVWWSLRAYRCLAIKFVMDWQFEGEPSLRTNQNSLLLTAACAWLLNGIHSTPDVGSAARDLMAAILPHVDRIGADIDILAYGTPTNDDDDDGDDDEEEREHSDSSEEGNIPNTRHRRDATTLPAYPYGLVFTRTLCISDKNPVPRFEKETHTITEKTFKFFFQKSLENLKHQLTKSRLNQSINPRRISNKNRNTALFVPLPQQDSVDDHFNLAALGHALEDIPTGTGSDLEDSDDEDLDDGGLTELERQRRNLLAIPPAERTIDMELTQVWRQFLFDLTARSPNRKGASSPSYCKLSQKERENVSEATYRNSVLSDYFIDVRYKIALRKDWTAVFNNLWPDANTPNYAKAQNYHQCRYFKDWDVLLRRSEGKPATINAMRKILKGKFNTLYWVPFAQRDRIWSTKFDRRFIKISGKDESTPAPMILIKVGGCDPSW